MNRTISDWLFEYKPCQCNSKWHKLTYPALHAPKPSGKIDTCRGCPDYTIFCFSKPCKKSLDKGEVK